MYGSMKSLLYFCKQIKFKTKNIKIMLGQPLALSDFIEGKKMQLIIPVYQRNYDWKIDNCDQLLSDLVKLKNSNRRNHFFGSIVAAPADSYGKNRLIIDGQQRLTTTSLLILAAIKAVKDGIMTITNESQIEDMMDIYLMARACQDPVRKYKLVPIEKDREAYDLLFSFDESKYIEKSKITRNFRHFYDYFKTHSKEFTFDELSDVIDRLQIISIDLQENDDPQLIFESLNSTGLALSEADKIRNYLLMSLPANEQNECYKEYWQKIEEATESDPTMFLRDYITIVQQRQRPVKINQLYFEWKRHMEGLDRKEEMKQMLVYSNFYRQIMTGEYIIDNGIKVSRNEKLTKKLKQLGNLQTDVLNVFLMQFMKYANENKMAEQDIWNVLNIVETYLARRIVCGLPSNTLTQVFCALHKDVMKSYDEYAKIGQPSSASYSEVLTYHILRRDGKYAIPGDSLFKQEILSHDIYHLPKPYQIFFFERLENGENKEFIDVATEMKMSEATIEHIMPQTLNRSWRVMLGENAEDVQERYLHTFANLTLTGVNTELSNNSFEDKKNGKEVKGIFINGYKSSKYRLTKDVLDYDKWTECELIARGEKIVLRLTVLYPMPVTSFKPLPKPVDEVTLDEEDFIPTNRDLRWYSIFGKKYEETVWATFYVNVVKLLYARYPDELETIIDKHYLWTVNKWSDKSCIRFDDNLYLWTSMDNKSKINALRYMFDIVDLPLPELTIAMEPIKNVDEE